MTDVNNKDQQKKRRDATNARILRDVTRKMPPIPSMPPNGALVPLDVEALSEWMRLSQLIDSGLMRQITELRAWLSGVIIIAGLAMVLATIALIK